MAIFGNSQSNPIPKNTTKAPTNKGGFWGGLGYLGEKLGVGAMQSIEGIWDYMAGGIADFFGADEWAEEQMNKDWFGDWYSHPEERFNPEGGWKVAGDVVGGIGSSLPAIGAAALAAGITVATGGTGAPAAAALASAAVAGFGAAGTATKEAYRESGELSGKEWGYGALVGGTEAAIEYATAGIGSGGGKAIKALGNIGRKGATEAATETAKAAAKKGLSSIVGKTVKHVGGDFLSEAAEEGIAEIMAPVYARMTYDPNAQNATAEEVAYAAFVGGLSGVIMGGTTTGINALVDNRKNAAEGKQVREQGAEAEVLRVAKEIALAEQASPSGYTVFEQILDVYQSAGEAPSNAQLGKLQVLTSAARVLPMTEQAAMQILSDTAGAVERYRATTGQDITAEQLTAGLPADFAERVSTAKTKEERQAVLKDLRHALSTNASLLNLSLASATGRMMVDAEAFADHTEAGRLASREEYEIFLEEASPQKKAEVAKIIGADSLDTVSYEEFRDAMLAYAGEHYADINEVRSMLEAAKAATPNEKTAPAAVGIALADGVHRYGSIAIIKQGDSIRLYDYTTDHITRKMTAQEATTALQRLRRQAPTQTDTKPAEEAAKAETAALDTWARDNLKGYNQLTGREQRTVRSMVRRARAIGVSESDVKMIAQVSVRSGIRIEFRKSVDVNGYYDSANSLIMLNPNARHNASRLLLHELSHALYTTKRGKKILDKYIKQMDKDRAAEIRKRYGEAGLAEHAAEEIAAHYAEDILGNRDIMERMLREEPTLGDKVLSFFKLAKTDYKGNERLSRAAGRLYNHFTKLFAEFSAQNRGGLIAEGVSGELRYSVGDGLPKITAEMSDAERTEILRKKKIVAPLYTGQADASIMREGAKLHHHKIGVVKATLERMAEEFGIIGEEINVEDVDVRVMLSKSNIGESISKEATPVQIAKLLPILRETVEASVGIESHNNRYYYDTDTVYFDNLLGGYIDGEDFVPVRFGLKHSATGKATLYVVVDQNIVHISKLDEIKKDTGHQAASPDLTESSKLHRRATYSISQVVRFVNSKDLLRYLPDEMLDEKQRTLKWEGIAETITNTNSKNDKKYAEYIAKGNLIAAKQMVLAAAKAAGYTHVGYHGTHAKPFTVFERGIAGIYLATNRKLAEDFATGFRGEVGTVYNLVAKIKKPFVVEEHIHNTVPYYYNVPTPTAMRDTGVSQSTVSTEEIAHFAEDNGYDGVIIKGIREGADVYTDDIIVFDPNQIKSADPVTYDDNGRVIPLSRRFDQLNPDIRYSLPDADDAAALATLAATEESVGAKREEYNPSIVKRVTSGVQRAYIESVNAQAGIEWYLRGHGVSRADAETKTQIARASQSQSQAMIGGGQYDIFSDNPEYMGKGLMQILQPTRAWSEDKQILFQQYLLHQLNIDRMTLESRSTAALSTEIKELQRLRKEIANKKNTEKAKTAEIAGAKKTAKRAELAETIKRLKKEIADLEKRAKKLKEEIDSKTLENKPIFGETDTRSTVTAEESRKVVEYLERTHHEMKGIAGELYKYLRNLQTMRVQAGIITQETADLLSERYPHYVPAFRADMVGLASLMGKNAIELAQTVKRAKGGSSSVNDVFESIAAQTEQLIRVGRTNMLLADIADIGDTDNVHIISEEDAGRSVDADMLSPELLNGNGQVTFYRDGKKVTMLVAEDIYQGLESLRKPSIDQYSIIERIAGRAMQLFKSGVTSYNPFFTVRNFSRDLQDAGINSKHPVLFAKNITTGRAAKLMLTNSLEWQEYRALGGFASTVFDGTLHELSGYAGFEPVFKMLESGKVTKREMLNAFRKLPKAARRVLNGIENLNAFVEQMPRFAEFLASIESGDSKAQALNNSAEVTTNFARSGRMTRRLNATVIPFLNASIQGFDKMFRNVSEVFTSGHVIGALASLLTKAILLGIAPAIINAALLDDDEDYEKLRDTDKENNILIKIGNSSFLKIPRGRMASVIGGLYLRTKRFTEGDDKAFDGYLANVTSQVTPVDSMSRTIFSPIIDVKTNRTWYGGEIEGAEFDDTAPVDRYDETTGSLAIWLGKTANGIGLEWSPKKIQYFLDQYTGVVGDVILPIGSKKERSGLLSTLTVDATVSNKLSQNFYDVYEETQWKKSAGDKDAEILLRYLNTITKSTRDLNKQIDETRKSNLSGGAKYIAVRDTRKLINAEYAASTVTIPAMQEAIRATADIEDDDLRYVTATRLAFGAEAALSVESKAAYERLSPLNSLGISYDVLFDYRLAIKGVESDKDKDGNAVPGSKRKKVLAIINKLPISAKERLLLFAISGYSAKAGEIKGISNPKRTLSQTIASAKGLKKADKIALAEACGLTVTGGVIKRHTP